MSDDPSKLSNRPGKGHNRSFRNLLADTTTSGREIHEATRGAARELYRLYDPDYGAVHVNKFIVTCGIAMSCFRYEHGYAAETLALLPEKTQAQLRRTKQSVMPIHFTKTMPELWNKNISATARSNILQNANHLLSFEFDTVEKFANHLLSYPNMNQLTKDRTVEKPDPVEDDSPKKAPEQSYEQRIRAAIERLSPGVGKGVLDVTTREQPRKDQIKLAVTSGSDDPNSVVILGFVTGTGQPVLEEVTKMGDRAIEIIIQQHEMEEKTNAASVETDEPR